MYEDQRKLKSKLALMICSELHKLRMQDPPHPSWTREEILESLKIVKSMFLDESENDNK